MYIFVCQFMAVYNLGDYIVLEEMYMIDVICIDIDGEMIKGVKQIVVEYVEQLWGNNVILLIW